MTQQLGEGRGLTTPHRKNPVYYEMLRRVWRAAGLVGTTSGKLNELEFRNFDRLIRTQDN
jgi:hypothetical protein